MICSGYWTPTEGLLSEWGPTHDCRSCGAAVQTYVGPRTPWPRTFNAGTWERHCCGAAMEIHDLIECFCGAQVLRFKDRHKENQDGSAHICKPVPRPVAPRPAPRAVARDDGGVIDL